MVILWIALTTALVVLLGRMVPEWSVQRTALSADDQGQPQVRSRTCKPGCPACQAEAPKPEHPPRPTLRVKKKAGRPRSVKTDRHYCPNKRCSHYGWVGLGNIVANGHPNSGPWRQLHCAVCGKYFAESTGTIFYRSPLSPDLLSRIIAALAEGVDIRATGRIFGVDPNTVKACLTRAVEHMDALSSYLIHDLQLTQVQVDELWALVQSWGEEPGAAPRLQRRQRWVWAAIDPISKLLLGTVVGDRSLVYAQLLIHAVVLTLAPGTVPLFLSDQLAHYATALLTHFGHWVEVPRRSNRGPHPKPRWEPLPELNYAQVVKRRVKGRVVEVTQRVVLGSAEAVAAALSRVGHQINTATTGRRKC
jgi:transposase-like protein